MRSSEGWRFGGRANENARLVVGGACCLGSKVHLLYLFPMVLVPMAHSSPMADITETCRGHRVRTSNTDHEFCIYKSTAIRSFVQRR